MKKEVSENNECVLKEAHEQRLDKIESDIDVIYGKVNKIDKDLAVSNSKILVTLNSLSQLPEVLTSVQTTMVKMQCSIDANNQKTDVLATDVSSLKQTVSDIEQEPYKEYKQTKHELKTSVLGQLLGAGALMIAGAIGVLVILVANGTIKL